MRQQLLFFLIPAFAHATQETITVTDSDPAFSSNAGYTYKVIDIYVTDSTIFRVDSISSVSSTNNPVSCVDFIIYSANQTVPQTASYSNLSQDANAVAAFFDCSPQSGTPGPTQLSPGPAGPLQNGLYQLVVAPFDAQGTGGDHIVTFELEGVGFGSTPPSTSDAAEQVKNIILSDVRRTSRSTINANQSMVSQGLDRFIADRNSGMSLGDAISTSGLNSVVVSPEMQAYGETLFGGGSFFGQSVSADGTYRKVTFGEFDVQHERGAGTTLSFNGRMAWERAAGEDAMVAYFLGAEVNRSEIDSTYTGDQKRYGLTAGVYGFKELENNLYLSGYGSVGVARSELDITDGASSLVTGNYTSRTMSLGGQVSGSVDYETYELRPSVSLNFVKTWIGDITLDESGAPLDVSVGDTTYGELIAKPEFLFPMEQQAGSKMVTVASVSPRLICERSDAANTVTKDCGAGLELGINGTSEDGATNLNASIRFDRVGGVDRQGLNLEAEFQF